MARPPRSTESQLHNRLAVLRAERGLSRQQLADAIAVNYQTVGYLERGDYSPSLELAFRLAEYFQLPIESIFAREPFAPMSQALTRGGSTSMSEITLPKVGTARRRTWRDAITPEGRASRRRWTLVFPALLCVSAWITVATYDDGGTGVDLLAPAALVIVFGMLRRSTRRLTALDHPQLDERDRASRDRAFRLAYPLLLAVLVISLAVLALVLPEATRDVPADFPRGATTSIPGGFLEFEALIGLALWLVIWAIFLPTGVLAWREPDALEPDAGEPTVKLSEAARDAWSAGALAAGFMLGIVQDVDLFALLPFVGVLALLGWVARHPHERAAETRARLG